MIPNTTKSTGKGVMFHIFQTPNKMVNHYTTTYRSGYKCSVPLYFQHHAKKLHCTIMQNWYSVVFGNISKTIQLVIPSTTNSTGKGVMFHIFQPPNKMVKQYTTTYRSGIGVVLHQYVELVSCAVLK